MGLDNDTRGWIMACVSGMTCILGASIICVDLIVQRLPRWRNFKIQDSNNFLASSLSLSFGVMFYSALTNMLPSSTKSLQDGGLSPTAAAYTKIGCFLGGAIGIQIISWALHHFIPSHVVDCDHAHKGEEGEQDCDVSDCGGHSDEDQAWSDDRPLLSRNDHDLQSQKPQRPRLLAPDIQQRPDAPQISLQNGRMSSFRTLQSFLSKTQCGEGGPCRGYSNLCGNECYRVVSKNRNGIPNGYLSNSRHDHIGARTNSSLNDIVRPAAFDEEVEDELPSRPGAWGMNKSGYGSIPSSEQTFRRSISINSGISSQSTEDDPDGPHSKIENANSIANHHHHHVASNAFLSIGLQTSIAIALHKLPEGFITYATNHANPKLGFSVFMALTIHNITEGFALALPLYLAVNNRIKAMFWASLLGGASQPLGAGIAVLWFRVAQSRDMVPNESVYGVMFAITSGIMTSVGYQLFAESLTLTHNKTMCIAFAFLGMGILGLSNALTA